MDLTLNTRSTEFGLASILYIQCVQIRLHNGDDVSMLSANNQIRNSCHNVKDYCTHHRLHSCKRNINPSSTLVVLLIVAVLIVSSGVMVITMQYLLFCCHSYDWYCFRLCPVHLTAVIVALLPFCCNSCLPMDFFMKLSSPVFFVD